MTMLLSDLADSRNRRKSKPRKRINEYTPDLDAPWNQRRDLLPIHAHCSNCVRWCGVCGLNETLVTLACDRCIKWINRIDDKVLMAWARVERERDMRMTQCGHARREFSEEEE
jgi:hypothetical protein